MELLSCIKVKDLRFFSHHGFYPEEQILGNEYFVSVEVTFPSKINKAESLENSFNYEWLYTLVAEKMKQPQKLLETVAQNIIKEILSKSDHLETKEVQVNICKSNPPFGGDKAKAVVELNWKK